MPGTGADSSKPERHRPAPVAILVADADRASATGTPRGWPRAVRARPSGTDLLAGHRMAASDGPWHCPVGSSRWPAVPCSRRYAESKPGNPCGRPTHKDAGGSAPKVRRASPNQSGDQGTPGERRLCERAVTGSSRKARVADTLDHIIAAGPGRAAARRWSPGSRCRPRRLARRDDRCRMGHGTPGGRRAAVRVLRVRGRLALPAGVRGTPDWAARRRSARTDRQRPPSRPDPAARVAVRGSTRREPALRQLRRGTQTPLQPSSPARPA